MPPVRTADPGGRPAFRGALWSVCVPTVSSDGRPGVHTFVVAGHTVADALKASETAVHSDGAQRHRRLASVDLARAVVSPWRG